MGMTILKDKEKKKEVNAILKKIQPEKGLDAKKYCGKLSLDMDPLNYQKKSRDEWK
jgi:hypothetical protein